jgi:hypothetical protein
MVNNLSAILNNADDETWSEGTYWYAVAHSFSADLADRYGVTIETAAGVVAALSPRLPWNLNMRAALDLFETGDAGVLGGNKAKALRILAGERPLDVLRGHKVRSFYTCILDPSQSAQVCIDRHAVDAALGVKGTDKSRKFLETLSHYQAVCDAYRAAANRLGISPAQAQAIVWVAWRNMHANRRQAS